MSSKPPLTGRNKNERVPLLKTKPVKATWTRIARGSAYKEASECLFSLYRTRGRDGGVTRSHHEASGSSLLCVLLVPHCLPLSPLICPYNSPSAPMITHGIGVQTHLCLANSSRFKPKLSSVPPLLALKGKGPTGGGKMVGPSFTIQQ